MAFVAVLASCSREKSSSTGWEFNNPDNGGYTVQPIPGPTSTKLEVNNNNNAGGNNQNEMLFIRGKAISGAPIIKGTNQFPNPPIKAGITKKNTISNPCAVTKTLYN